MIIILLEVEISFMSQYCVSLFFNDLLLNDFEIIKEFIILGNHVMKSREKFMVLFNKFELRSLHMPVTSLDETHLLRFFSKCNEVLT